MFYICIGTKKESRSLDNIPLAWLDALSSASEDFAPCIFRCYKFCVIRAVCISLPHDRIEIGFCFLDVSLVKTFEFSLVRFSQCFLYIVYTELYSPFFVLIYSYMYSVPYMTCTSLPHQFRIWLNSLFFFTSYSYLWHCALHVTILYTIYEYISYIRPNSLINCFLQIFFSSLLLERI